MAKPLKLFIAGISSILLLGAFSKMPGDNRLPEILSMFERYVLTRPQEKLYVHTDKTLYAAGEDIWFCTYLVDASGHRPDSISRTVYVELFSNTNKLLQRKVLYSPAGFSNGDFHLTENMPNGRYIIRAYTNYMKNTDQDFFFTKEISVVNLTESNGDAIPLPANLADMQFFPESGELLADVENRVAFKAVNQTGKGIPVDGKVFDESGTMITSFKSEHNGMGLITFIPSTRHHYTAKITDTNYTFPLPEATTKGYLLRVTDVNSHIKITAYSDVRKFSSEPCIVYLIAQSRGVVCYAAKGEILNASLNTKIPKHKFPTGITQITLFDAAGVPQCERLIFINHQNELTLSVKPDQAAYGKKKAVAIDLDVRKKDGSPAAGNFSISIFDGSRIPSEEYPGTIVNNLLLTSDLKGRIENPGYYLKDTLAETKRHLDLVMMTNGWRRFTWKAILQNVPDPILFPAENGIVISGKVLKSLSKKPSANSDVKIFTKQAGIAILKTDSMGIFYTDQFSFYDSTDILFQTNNAKGKQTDLQFKLDPFNIPPEMNSVLMSAGADDLNHLAEKVRASNIMLSTMKTTILKEVEVRATKTVENNNNTVKLYGVADATLNMKDLPQGSGDILSAIQGRVAGVMVTGNTVSIRGGGMPLFLLDGMRVDLSTITSIPINSIESVDVLKNPETTSIYGGQGGNGVIAVYTKKGYVSVAPTVGIHLIKYPGFYRAREFYSPNYDVVNVKSDSADVRSTLYWNPAIKTNSEGKAHVHFFTSDASAPYRVIIEGISDDGIPGYGSHEFIVR